MKQVTRIPLWRTFLNWVIAVIVGSILWPTIMSLFQKGPGLNDIGSIMLISVVFSAATSFPAMLILLFTNWQLNKQEMPRSRYLGIHMLVHIVVAVLTFSVIYVFASRELGRDFFVYLILALTYTVVGLSCWGITFAIYRRKQVHRTELREDILDEL